MHVVESLVRGDCLLREVQRFREVALLRDEAGLCVQGVGQDWQGTGVPGCLLCGDGPGRVMVLTGGPDGPLARHSTASDSS
ncbi:hypothetical protein [Streptomyces fungicidicus]|uniref:hypothetical protein n=1 Tax=Streptomyces fungicidicus TaxID=68203 RepID=UPI0033F22F2C